MDTASRVRLLVEPLVEAAGASVYDVEHTGGVLRITVQRDGGVDIDVIGKLTRQISHLLDEEDPDVVHRLTERMQREALTVRAYRFEGDRHCRAERFAAFAQALGDRFVARMLPDDAANTVTPSFYAQVVASPHSVVTAHLIDEQGQPTVAARDEILGFFAQRLLKG